ncbi:hypothetical protein At1D1460_45790 [Agrobacterium tumefaciens]|uniref:catalase n=1 Tax=Agrobacterium tumefaciens str. B6 TaxID=1183423 RepID=A0A822V5N9_AGRTU|nr:hypothetical protein At1D1460_45790 [Agrobacterium tumefaciens]KWT81796.1 hypothetical protein ASB65_14720 [Agrobacterium tumefaciens str. B6]OCJ28036.1 hypothetical protein A6U90_16310 [Agrobacterium tumefaciens]CVI21201.1 hypothetical protein AGR4A_Lc130198 [Agrobacterium tumefaciens str. B6]SPZ48031.1 Catalase C [Agrobacterium tumefaciens]
MAKTRTPAFVRFSTVAGNKGSADLARDVRGFALPGEEGLACFVSNLGKLRIWGREPSVKLGKASPPVK